VHLSVFDQSSLNTQTNLMSTPRNPVPFRYGQVYKALRGGVQDVAAKQITVRSENDMDKFTEARSYSAAAVQCSQARFLTPAFRPCASVP